MAFQPTCVIDTFKDLFDRHLFDESQRKGFKLICKVFVPAFPRRSDAVVVGDFAPDPLRLPDPKGGRFLNDDPECVFLLLVFKTAALPAIALFLNA
jgi:hypothetical protein